MIAIYSPTAISHELRLDLEQALDRDGARITFVGNDGIEEFVIVEAEEFCYTKLLEQEQHIKLIIPLG